MHNTQPTSSNIPEVEPNITKIFLNFIKSAWLLDGLSRSPEFATLNYVVQESLLFLEDVSQASTFASVISITHLPKSALEHIDLFYMEVFELPDYNLINDQGDFRIAMSMSKSATTNSDMRPMRSPRGQTGGVSHSRTSESVSHSGVITRLSFFSTARFT
jgi:hypothetical protein